MPPTRCASRRAETQGLNPMSWSAVVSRRWWRGRSFTISSRSGRDGRTGRLVRHLVGGCSGRWPGPRRSTGSRPWLALRQLGSHSDWRLPSGPGAASAGVPQAMTSRRAARGDHDLNPGPPLAGSDGSGTRRRSWCAIVERGPTAQHDPDPAQPALSRACRAGRLSRRQIRPGDAALDRRALREALEETGLEARFVRPVGLSTPISRAPAIRVIPVVGAGRPGFALAPAPDEVADVFEVPLAFLMIRRHHRRETRDLAGSGAPFYAMP